MVGVPRIRPPTNHFSLVTYHYSLHFACAKCRGHPFFRSYGARLPSSLTRFHSRAWVYSTHPPVSDYGTGNRGNIQLLFLIQVLADPPWPEASASPCGTVTFNRRTLST